MQAPRKLNLDYWIDKKNILILGHNSNCKEIMKGFRSFCNEWDRKDSSEEILNITVIDDPENLERMNNYEEYSFVTETIPASVFDKEVIFDTVNRFISENLGDISVLILSDDTVENENQDATALANLVYIQEIISSKSETDKDAILEENNLFGFSSNDFSGTRNVCVS